MILLLSAISWAQTWTTFPAAPYENVLSGGAVSGTLGSAVAHLYHPTVGLSGVAWTAEVRDGNGWGFRGLSASGILAVFRPATQPYGGIATALAGITCVDVAEDTAFPQGYVCLVVCGYDGSGASVVKGFVYDGTATQGPELGTLFDFPAGSQPQAGEQFVSASLLGTDLFVQDGVTGCLFRFIDTNGDFLPDSRNPSFCVGTVGASPPVVKRGPIDRFRHHPNFAVRTFHRHGRQGSGVVFDGGQLVYRRQHRFDADPPTTLYPVLPWGVPVGGQTRVLALGLPGQQLDLEVSSAPTGPWNSASVAPVTAIEKSAPGTLLLTAPLTGGQWVRLKVLNGGATSMPQEVSLSRPILYTKHIGALSGSVFSLEGDNLALPSAARFRPLGALVDLALTVSAGPTGSAVSVTAPTTTSHLQGFCLLEFSGQPPVAFYLMVSP